MPEREITYSAALNEALREEMARDPSVFVMGEDVGVWGDDGGVFGVTKGLLKEFGAQRVRDTPIAEEAIVALGVGSAMTGMRPVCELMYFDFVTLAMEPLVNQAAKIRYMTGGQATVPLVLRSNIGASGGKAAQHSQSLETWLMHVPGLTVVVPSTPYDAKGLLKTAIRDDNPVVFLEHKLLYFTRGHVPLEEYAIPFGQAVVRRPGRDLTLVACQQMLQHALTAAEVLAGEGYEIEVIDPRTLAPLDLETIVDSVRRTSRLAVCHEAPRQAGWAAEIAAAVSESAFDYLDAPVQRICGADVPVPYAAELEDAVVPNVEDILAGLRRTLVGARPGTPRANVTPARPDPADHAAETAGQVAPSAAGGVALVMPRLSDTMATGTVSEWLKQPGDAVGVGDPLVEVETDKATVTVDALSAGVLLEIVAGAGSTVDVGATIALIGGPRA